jgi:2-iminobutanoate/2-iminopropanoate deaminase
MANNDIGVSMSRKIIMSSQVTKPKAPLSHAVRTGNLIFVSGTTPLFGDRNIAKGDFAAQMHQVMKNITAILADAGTTLDKVVKANVILTRIQDFDEMNAIYRSYFQEGNYPARTTIQAPLAIQDMLLEIECIAEV